jgi:hypothetical protein
LYAKNTSKVNGFRVATEVPEGALFTDDQSASEVLVNALNTLEAETVQQALEQLQQMLEETGDMKQTVYDRNNDDIVDNAATVNGLRVETDVPVEALFTDSQRANEVALVTATDIDGDGTPESTVEAALIELNKLLKKLQGEAKASTGERILASTTEASAGVTGTHRPCLATHYDETTDALSFITGTERGQEIKGRILDGEPINNYCHYIYEQKSFIASSYKVIEEKLMGTTKDPEQALRSSFISTTNKHLKGKSLNFSQPLLCRHPQTKNWGSLETRNGKELCVFGVSFTKGDGTSVLDLGASQQYELYSNLPGSTARVGSYHSHRSFDGRDDYKCAQVNQNSMSAVEHDHLMLEGHYNFGNGSCLFANKDEVFENFFVYYSPVNNFISDDLGGLVLSKSDIEPSKFQPEDKMSLKEYLWEHALYVNVSDNTYESVSYQRNYDYLCNDADKVCNMASFNFNDPTDQGDSNDEFVLLGAYDLNVNTEFEVALDDYLHKIKQKYNDDVLLRLYLYELKKNEKIETNIKIYVTKKITEYHPNLLSDHPEIISQESQQGDSKVSSEKTDLRILSTSDSRLEHMPITLALITGLYNWLPSYYAPISDISTTMINNDLLELENLSDGVGLREHILSNSNAETHFHTELNSVHRFIRERLEIDPNAFPSYFQHNHPELILNGVQLDAQDRVAIMMADLSYQCPDILKDWDAEAIDLTKPGRVFEKGSCYSSQKKPNSEAKQAQDLSNVQGGGQQGNDNNPNEDRGGNQGDGNNNNNNNPGGNNDPNPQDSDTCKYVGQVNDNKPHGIGKMTYSDGAVHDGSWKDGERHGQGTYNDANGDMYEGMWWGTDEQYFLGNINFHSGQVYEGLMIDGNLIRGIMAYNNGCIYNGRFERRLPNGQGTMTYADGTKYVGQFKNGILDGKGTIFYNNGDVYEGEINEYGKSHGQGKMTKKDGTVYEGVWKDGEPTRQGKVTFSQGALDKIGKFYYNEKVCPICHDEFEVKNLSVLTPCNHIFHEKCIETWQQQKNSCPSCRIEIKDRLPISSDLVIKQIEEYKIQNPQNQNEGADQNDIIIEEENNLQQGQPELLITQLYKLMQRLDGQEENSNVNMDDITNLVIALTSSDSIKINTQIKKLNEALNKESEQQMPDNQYYKKKLNLLKEAVENFKNSKQ